MGNVGTFIFTVFCIIYLLAVFSRDSAAEKKADEETRKFKEKINTVQDADVTYEVSLAVKGDHRNGNVIFEKLMSMIHSISGLENARIVNYWPEKTESFMELVELADRGKIPLHVVAGLIETKDLRDIVSPRMTDEQVIEFFHKYEKRLRRGGCADATLLAVVDQNNTPLRWLFKDVSAARYYCRDAKRMW